MTRKNFILSLALLSLLSFLLTSCYRPPFNNFKPYQRGYVAMPQGAAVGTAALAIAGGPVLVGTVGGAVVGGSIAAYKNSRRALIRDLALHEIYYVEYGDTMTLVVPTDRYFLFNSPRFNQLCFPGLYDIVKLIQKYAHCPVYVAAFTNDVGYREHKKRLTQAQAETMLTFLWANGIPARYLNAEGYADKHPVGDNKLIHGSAQNRRLEIQFFCNCSKVESPQSSPLAAYTK